MTENCGIAALYNLGWLEVARADAQLKSNPEQAKQHLQQAVNRFREAVRVRPDADEVAIQPGSRVPATVGTDRFARQA